MTGRVDRGQPGSVVTGRPGSVVTGRPEDSSPDVGRGRWLAVTRAPAYSCAVQLSPRALTALAIALTACGEPQPELREWQPSDHGQPSAADPAATDRAVAPPEDSSPEQTEIRAATALFRSMCASCHGEAGRGDGPGRPPVAEVADLSTREWQESRTDQQIAEVVREGRGGFMPAFGDRLSPAGVDALVRHIRRLGGAATDAPTGAATDAPTGAATDAPTGAATDAPTGATTAGTTAGARGETATDAPTGTAPGATADAPTGITAGTRGETAPGAP